MEYLCNLTNTPTGGVVLDPFGGSGTTAMACVNTNRDYILIEKDPEYCEIARRRVEYAKETQGERALGMKEMTHTYAWGNNAVRKQWQGKKCRILVSGGRNSCLVEFENGEQLNTSWRALRRIKT